MLNKETQQWIQQYIDANLDIRTGLGYDVHVFETGEHVVLGGVKIPCDGSLKGHSDADVILHALMDALLGAQGKPDIGHYFPPTDPAYHNIDSRKLLSQVYDDLKDRWSILSVDLMVVAEKPRLAPHVPLMKAAIASILKIDEDRIGLKSTTKEGMDDVGKSLGIESFASVCIRRKIERN